MLKKLTYPAFRDSVALVLGVFTGVLHIAQFTFMPMESIKFFAWHLMLGLVLVFLYKPLVKKPSNPTAGRIALASDWLLIACSFLVGLSVIIRYSDYSLMMQTNQFTPYFRVMGIIIALLSLEAARRVLGWVLPAIALLTVAYALFGGNLPGLLGHRGYPIPRIAATIFSDQGVYGTPIAVSASNIYLFLMFAGLLNSSGADKIFQNVAIACTGKKRGGPAKMAVVASCLFGSISGSAAANVMSTGAFTIPLMKAQGYKKRFSGAVEAVASTGGQIMPPIMGAAAFVLSDITGVSYAEVCLAALLPAFMYYATLFKMVDLESVKHQLQGLPPEGLPNLRESLKGGFKLVAPVAVLLFLLLVKRMTPMLAVIYASGVMIVCGAISKNDRLTLKRILYSLKDSGRSLLQVVSACACSGIVTGMFALTGLGLKFSNFIMHIGSGNIALSLIFAMLICIVLGMGLPATAAYIICATAIAPALVSIGIPLLAAHLFLFYFASISAITPPVAVASYAAAGIAEANALKVSVAAVKLGIAGFALPFTFVLNPDYLHFGFDLLTLTTWLSAFVVCYSAAIVVQGWVERKITLIERILYVGVMVSAIHSSVLLSCIGWVLFAALFIVGHRVPARKRA